MKFLLDCNGPVTPTIMCNRLMQVVDKLSTGVTWGELRTGEMFWLVIDDDDPGISSNDLIELGWDVKTVIEHVAVRKPERGKLDLGDVR